MLIVVSNYAIGKRALALCDRCGFQYKYLELKKEWNGHKVCKQCFETKEPQLDPLPHASDPEALFEPRTDQQEEGGVFTIRIKNTGDDFASDVALFELPVPELKSAIGLVTVTT